MSLYSELKRRNVLRIAAAYLALSWLLIQIVETVFPAFGFGDAAVRVAVISIGVGFFPVLLLAWIFELTPDGVKRDRDSRVDTPERQQSGKNLDRIIMLVLVLALTFFSVDKFLLDPARDATREKAVAEDARSDALTGSYGERSIVVLPFLNMSDDASNEYFSDGITEELLNLLASVRELRVISRTSAFSYKGRDINIQTVAQELDVAHVLEGSVRKSGNDVRVTAQLIDARTDTHLWSETYERTIDDVFAIQDEIASHIFSELKVRLGQSTRRTHVTDPETHSLYLQARSIVVLGNVTSEQRAYAEELLKQVLANDPNYVPAMNELKRVYWQRAFGEGTLSVDEGLKLMDSIVSRVLAIDPDDAETNMGLSGRAVEIDNDFVTAARFWQRAIAADPTNEDVLWSAPGLLVALTRYDEVIEIAEFGITRSPLFSGLHNNLVNAYYRAGRFADSIDAANKFSLLFPGMSPRAYRKGHSQLMLGDFEGALETFEASRHDMVRPAGMAKALLSLGRMAEFEKLYSSIVDTLGDTNADDIAMICAWAGDADAAFEWLDKWFDGVARPNGEKWVPDIGSISYVLHDPMFGNLHSDPRWPVLLESKGVSKAQLDEIEISFDLP